MIAELRRQFNTNFTAEKYQRFLERLNQRCGTAIQFRVCETPCFFPAGLMGQMAAWGEELVQQLLRSEEYRKASDESVPAEFNTPNQERDPLFVSVDFGLVRGSGGELKPKLVELQAFPTLYGYQPLLAQAYVEDYGLAGDLRVFFKGLTREQYHGLLRRAVLGRHAPENVVLLEIDPQEQKTLPDFLVTDQICGIRMVNIREVVKQGSKLHYRADSRLIPIHRIYNRVIIDELLRKKIETPFDFRDELQVEWAGHPNWYFRISKFSIPFLKHECVPRTWFLHQLKQVPKDRENYLLKPLYSFAGSGIIFSPTDEQLAAIPAGQRQHYILQERMQFAPVIETPHGATQAEVRVMYLWLEGERLRPVLGLTRMGRGKMMGVDHNRNLEWVGGSAVLMRD